MREEYVPLPEYFDPKSRGVKRERAPLFDRSRKGKALVSCSAPQRAEGRERGEDIRSRRFSIEQSLVAVLAFEVTLEHWKLFDKAIFYVFLSVSLAVY